MLIENKTRYYIVISGSLNIALNIAWLDNENMKEPMYIILSVNIFCNTMLILLV